MKTNVHSAVCSCGHVHKNEQNCCEASMRSESCAQEAAKQAKEGSGGHSPAERTDPGDDELPSPDCGCGNDCCSDDEDGCGCEEEKDKSELKKEYIRLGISAVFFAAGIIFPDGIIKSILFIASYAVAGYTVLWEAVKKLAALKAFDETLLMSIATVGAAALGDFAEAAAVMILFGIGEILQSAAVGSSKRSISALLDLKPNIVNRVVGGVVETAAPEEIEIGDHIIVKPYERVPLDGIVTEGESRLDTSAITGESVPVFAGTGSTVLAGSMNGDGVLTLRVSAVYADSAVSKIIKMTEQAARQKSPREKFITRFARVYTPAVVALAALIALIPPFILGIGSFREWLYTALTFLVISCPCALVISVPLAFFAGIGAASNKGMLIKGSVWLEMLAKIKTAVFDKTGTLTKGEFSVVAVVPNNTADGGRLVELCAYAESRSTHPIARSIATYYGNEIDASRIGETNEIRGRGVASKVDGRDVLAGSTKLLLENGVEIPAGVAEGTVVYVAEDKKYLGYIVLGDKLKNDSISAIMELKRMGIMTVMLTGDSETAASPIARQAGIDEYRAAMLPEHKLEYVTELKKISDGPVAFVGDGINDAPVIAAADVGISMGGLGSDAAIEASDIVLMTDEPGVLVSGIKTAKKTLKIVSQNIYLSLGIKAAIMLIGVFGFSSMWLAIAADVGASLLAVGNSMRVMSFGKRGRRKW